MGLMNQDNDQSDEIPIPKGTIAGLLSWWESTARPSQDGNHGSHWKPGLELMKVMKVMKVMKLRTYSTTLLEQHNS